MMFNYFKKPAAPAAPRQSPAIKRQEAAAAAQAQAKLREQARADAKAKEAEEARQTWQPQLQAALGDDAGLLRVARESPLVDVKLAAVQALAGEDALKQAEREFRSHDRRVHRAAKLRLDAAVAQRESRVQAQIIIDAARALSAETPIPANRLVALDRAWQVLNAELLEPQQRSEFAVLREQLNHSVRERGEQEQQVQRWVAQAKTALGELQRACALPGLAEDAQALQACCANAQALRASRIDAAATAALDEALQGALDDAAQLLARWAEPPKVEAAPEPIVAPAPAAPVAPRTLSAEQRQALEALLQHAETALGDGQLGAMQQQLEAVDALLDTFRGVKPGDALNARIQALYAERGRLKGWQQWGGSRARDDLVVQAEALARFTEAAGARTHGAAAAPHPTPADEALAAAAPPQAAPEQASAIEVGTEATTEIAVEVVAAEIATEAATEATAVAASEAAGEIISAEIATEAASAVSQAGEAAALLHVAPDASPLTTSLQDATATPAAPAPAAPRRPPPSRKPGVPKLQLKAHADAIADLRRRWKELDRLGAPANQQLWRRFDAALTVAHEPVAAQLAVLKAQREANLAAREALLAELDGLAAQPPEPDDPQANAAFWKEQARVLENFQRAWRPLGPLEHTVPAAARKPLQQRLAASLERVEAPLEAARGVAEGVRRELIERAEALLEEVKREPQLRDAVPRVRDLQTQWQHSARQLTLQRGVESALWSRFKAATDAVFTQRDAAANSRDAELAANLAVREALLQRLEALSSATPTALIERTLADVDREWRMAGEPPRGTLGALEARLQAAHAAALRALSASGQVAWQAQCDGVAARLALCEEREAAPADDNADLAQRWAALDAADVKLPAAWQQALAQRWAHSAQAQPATEAQLDDMLTHLEASLDLPATPERLAARRALKLRALKDTLEGRGAPAVDAGKRAQWLATLLRSRVGDALLRERLHALVAALHRAPAGTLVGPQGKV